MSDHYFRPKRKPCWKITTAIFLVAATLLIALLNYHHHDNYLLPTNFWPKVLLGKTGINLAVRNSMDKPTPTPTKKILFWVPFFDRKDYYFGLGREPFVRYNCPVQNCETTTDRSAVNTSHAVIFHYRNLNCDLRDMPNWRAWWQRWIFFLMESPVFTYPDLRIYSGVFNWTMTYRLDSDIVVSYGYVENVTQPQNSSVPLETNSTERSAEVPPVEREKSRMIAWIVSNCNTPGGRENYVNELKRHISVDVYGNCGKPCPGKECEKQIYRTYRYYLAFENSVCSDYVTEKFYKTLQYDIVPIVYGGGNYLQSAPPHSYIDVRNFSSPRDLASYLELLATDDQLYNQYFEWKKQYRILQDMSNPFCQLCAKLNEGYEVTKTYDDIYSWWVVQGNCHLPDLVTDP